MHNPDKQYYFAEKDGGKLFLFFLSKLKSNVKGVETGIKFKDIMYYKFSALDEVPETMYCTDLNSAYLQALFNAGIINEDSYKFGEKIPKQDRLKGVGALATKKTLIKYSGGVMQTPEIIESENENIFWFACYQVGNLLKQLIPESPTFLFFWVDGIYFKTFCEAYKAKMFFSKFGYPSKIEFCLKAKKSENGKLLYYYKDDELKVFTLPQPEKRITDEKIINWMTDEN